MKVSVIIPCYNVEAHLPAALDSAFAQDHADLEVVAVNDGSTDTTGRILANYHERHGDRLTIVDQQNRGACAARNAGMRASAGEAIQFLDADDFLEPDKIGEQVRLLNEGADLVVGDYERIMPNGLLLPELALYDQPWMALIRTRMGTTSANLWRRSAVEAAGGWDEGMRSSQDYELMFRLLKQEAKVAWDRRVATHVLKRDQGSISRTDERANWERYVALRGAMRDHLLATDAVKYAPEIGVLEQYIFMALRILATYDIDAAVALFKRHIGRGFVPEVGRAITERYVLLYKLLGFRQAERLLQLRKNPSATHG